MTEFCGLELLGFGDPLGMEENDAGGDGAEGADALAVNFACLPCCLVYLMSSSFVVPRNFFGPKVSVISSLTTCWLHFLEGIVNLPAELSFDIIMEARDM